MKTTLLAVSLGFVYLLSSPGPVRSQDDSVQDIRGEIDALQAKLRALESAKSSATKERTTQLGRSRIPQREEEPALLLQIYDLSDLLAPISPYPAMVTSDLGPYDVPAFPSAVQAGNPSGVGGMMGGGMGGMGGGMFNVSSHLAQQATTSDGTPRVRSSASAAAAGLTTNRISFDDLINAITSTIEPASWDAAGGPEEITALGNSLLVSAGPRVHEQITNLFDTFRKRWGTLRTVSLQAHWLWLNDAQLASLLEEQTAKTGERPPFGLVSDAAWDALMKELRQTADKRPGGYQAVVTCYNGQTVHAISGSQRRVISEVEPIFGLKETVAYQPVVRTIQEGAVLQITPMVTSAGKLVALDVHSRVVLINDKPGPGPRDADGDRRGRTDVRNVVAVIDRLQIANHHLETTCRMPVDRRMLIGGMTFEAAPKAGEPALYLFVKATVQELRDDRPIKPETAPAPPPAAKRAAAPAAPVKKQK